MDPSHDVHAPLDSTPSSSSHRSLNSSTRLVSTQQPPRRHTKRSTKRTTVQTNIDFYASYHASATAALVSPRPFPSTSPHTSVDSTSFPSPIWSTHERDIFFSSLSRNTQRRPDLIALDLAPSKTFLQVCFYLSLLQAGLARINAKRTTRERERGRLAHPPAREMSERWVQFEEDMAEGLLARDAEREREAVELEREAERKKIKRTAEEARLNKEGKLEKEREWFRSDWREDLTVARLHALELEYKNPTHIPDTPLEPRSSISSEPFPNLRSEPFSAATLVPSNSQPKSDIPSGLFSQEIIQRIKDRAAAAASSTASNPTSSTTEPIPNRLTKKEEKQRKIAAGESEWHERRRAAKEAREAREVLTDGDVQEKGLAGTKAAGDGAEVIKRKRKRGIPWKERSARAEAARMGLIQLMENDGSMLFSMKAVAQMLQSSALVTAEPSTSDLVDTEATSPSSPLTSISSSTLLALRRDLKSFLSSLIRLSLSLQPTSEGSTDNTRTSNVKILPSGETEVVKSQRKKAKKGDEQPEEAGGIVVLGTESITVAAGMLTRERLVDWEDEEEEEGGQDGEADRTQDDEEEEEMEEERSTTHSPARSRSASSSTIHDGPLPQTIFNTLDDASTVKRARFPSPSYSDEDSDSYLNEPASTAFPTIDPLGTLRTPSIYLLPSSVSVDDALDYEIAGGLMNCFGFSHHSSFPPSHQPTSAIGTTTNSTTGLILHTSAAELLDLEDGKDEEEGALTKADKAEVARDSMWEAGDEELDDMYEEKVWEIMRGMDGEGKGWTELEGLMKDWEEGRLETDSSSPQDGKTMAALRRTEASDANGQANQNEMMDED